ncbi:MAG: DUF2726 domain-containing protein [Burkholderiales bacterium]|jgi:hypothetical protein|nr:DUF2726 domain-containing protein [Burkholderiales bacterium]
MIAFWYLLILAPFIVIPVLWWNYRRKLAQKEALSGMRWERLVKTARVDDASAPAVTAATPEYRRRERLLDAGQTLVYLLLKQGMPDHEVLANVALAELLEPPSGSGDAGLGQPQQLLKQHRVDFVVCSKAMQPVVAVDLLAAEPPAALTTAPDFKSQCLQRAGIRHVRLVRNALPGRQEIRARVLGG